jgi:ribonuclease HII
MTDYAIEDSVRNASIAGQVCGVDEVGRGALFGPVVAAAVILDPNRLPQGLTDSKLLSPSNRNKWSAWIYTHALATGMAWEWNDVIDEINILQATRRAMATAVGRLGVDVAHILVDGPIRLDLDTPQTAVIKGDQKSLSIAAASVIAKVLRDQLMEQMAPFFPEYDLQKNRGYPTNRHRSVLSCTGLSTYHRMSFRKG